MDWLGRAADRAASRDGYVASRHSTADVRAALDCGHRSACRVRLCRLPRPEHHEADVQEIAAYAGVDARRLAALLA